MPSIFGLSVVTGGLSPVQGNQTSLVTGGLFPILVPQPGPLDSSAALVAGQQTTIAAAISSQTGSSIPLANQIQTSIGIPIGQNNVQFSLTDLLQNPMSASGSQIYNPNNMETAEYYNNTTTYTGSDLRVIVDMVNATTASNTQPELKQLIECTTFTVSVHREKAAVRAAGYINPKGFARGRRTIAGTMVMTQFTVDTLYAFIKGQMLLGSDLSKDTQYVHVDQLPPFNMTLMFGDEYGNVSYRRVLGVDFVTDGVVYSSNDMLTEQTVSYMASDFTPLVDIDTNTLFRPNVTSQIFAPETTPGNIMGNGSNSQVAIPPSNIFSSNGSN